MRTLLATAAGIVVAVIVIFATQYLSSMIYPLPAGLDMNDRAAMARVMAAMPAGALLMVLLGYALGALAGGFTAARLAVRHPMTRALVVGGALTIAGIVNVMSLPHPTWFVVLNIPEFLIFAWLGAKVAQLKSSPLTPHA